MLIAKHIRLIWLAEYLENEFNMLILQQMIGISFQLCLLGYDTLRSTGEGDAAKVFTLVIIGSCISSTLLAYCYIGECLINESQTFGEAFYQCEWYNISRNEMKLMLICMMRSKKQIQLTSGKFFVLSLSAFTDVIKTSMAYLSVLRQSV
ncbi:hypothetical protein KPH14_002611 [Odynerus spinipes]|uniref:Uncharacterized protein n=1 Tax=Odynerus spinipes TaxID=1348599 RepID=A0AAD9R8B4_9HYME|nr:hypothetical protein KPH14_002611 [Odynerus spinipes]